MRFGSKSHCYPDFREKKKTKPTLFFDYTFIMSTLRGIKTEKELLKASDKKQRRCISLQKEHKNFIAAARN